MSRSDLRAPSWYARAARHADSLAPRVAALDSRFYYGCGFHYAKQEQLQKIRAMLADGIPADAREALMVRIILEVFLEGLTRDVRAAELSADAYAAEQLEA